MRIKTLVTLPIFLFVANSANVEFVFGSRCSLRCGVCFSLASYHFLLLEKSSGVRCGESDLFLLKCMDDCCFL